jgi:hypothetical protein
MSADEFIGYVGDPDFHDGSLLRVVVEGDLVRIVLQGASGQEYDVRFRRGGVVRSSRPEGMIIYAIGKLLRLGDRDSGISFLIQTDTAIFRKKQKMFSSAGPILL